MVNGSFNFSGDDSIIFLFCAFTCVCCAAMAAGMTIGLLSLDTLKLRIKLSVGTPAEKAAAGTILPILENHHWLLCTLLLFNAGANEALPIFLDSLVPSWCAVIISVTLVLICGEVIPTAIFSGPHQLAIAAKFTPFVYCLRALLSPIAFPMAKVLDCVLGIEEEDDTLNRDEMGAMVNIIREEQTKAREHAKKKKQQQLESNNKQGVMDSNSNNKVNPRGFFRRALQSQAPAKEVQHLQETRNVLLASDAGDEDELSNAEINVITGVLGLSKIKVRDICIPMNEVNMLSDLQILTPEVIDAIDKVGHSRLPVFRGSNINDIIGFFIAKKLMTVNPEKNVPLSTFTLNAPIVVGANISVLDAMKIFQQSATHLALVSEEPGVLSASISAGVAPKASAAPIGIITIEDIFEAMLQEDIEDETDFALRDSRMSAASSLREMSMGMNSNRPSALMPYAAGAGASGMHAHGTGVGAGVGAGGGAAAGGDVAMTDRNSGFGVDRTSFGVERTSSVASMSTTTFPKAIRPTMIQPTSAVKATPNSGANASAHAGAVGASSHSSVSAPAPASASSAAGTSASTSAVAEESASYSPNIKTPLIPQSDKPEKYDKAPDDSAAAATATGSAATNLSFNDPALASSPASSQPTSLKSTGNGGQSGSGSGSGANSKASVAASTSTSTGAEPVAVNPSQPQFSQLKPSIYNKYHHRTPRRKHTAKAGAAGNDDTMSCDSEYELSKSTDWKKGDNMHSHLEEGLYHSRASSFDSVTPSSYMASTLAGAMRPGAGAGKGGEGGVGTGSGGALGLGFQDANAGLTSTQSLLRTKGLTGSMLARHLGSVKAQRQQSRTSSGAASVN